MIGVGIGVGFQCGTGAHVAATSNLLTFTEQFDNAIWEKDSVIVVANAATDPLGGLTADSLSFLLSGAVSQLSSAGGVSGDSRDDAAVTTAWTRFSSTASIDGNPYVGSVYLKTLAGTATVTLALGIDGEAVRFTLTDFGGLGPFEIVAWGAQLETGTVPTTYVPRTT